MKLCFQSHLYLRNSSDFSGFAEHLEMCQKPMTAENRKINWFYNYSRRFLAKFEDGILSS